MLGRLSSNLLLLLLLLLNTFHPNSMLMQIGFCRLNKLHMLHLYEFLFSTDCYLAFMVLSQPGFVHYGEDIKRLKSLARYLL